MSGQTKAQAIESKRIQTLILSALAGGAEMTCDDLDKATGARTIGNLSAMCKHGKLIRIYDNRTRASRLIKRRYKIAPQGYVKPVKIWKTDHIPMFPLDALWPTQIPQGAPRKPVEERHVKSHPAGHSVQSRSSYHGAMVCAW